MNLKYCEPLRQRAQARNVAESFHSDHITVLTLQIFDLLLWNNSDCHVQINRNISLVKVGQLKFTSPKSWDTGP